MFAPTSTLGKIVRLPLGLIPEATVLPILGGPNRGLKWIVGAGTHSCWLGRYERQEIVSFLRHLSRETIVWDIGAHAGYFALACAQRCKQVVACEALPQNVNYCQRHIALNGLSNISVLHAAVTAEHGGTIGFGGSSSSYQGRAGGGGIVVPTVTIDGMVADGHPPPHIIKMDIEGGEVEALKGALKTMRTHRPKMLIAVHSEDLRNECASILGQQGYAVETLNIATIWASPSPG